MRVVRSVRGPSGIAEPVEQSAGNVRATGTGARSMCSRWRSPSGAAFAGAWR